jgi:hypothetical protein
VKSGSPVTIITPGCEPSHATLRLRGIGFWNNIRLGAF